MHISSLPAHCVSHTPRCQHVHLPARFSFLSRGDCSTIKQSQAPLSLAVPFSSHPRPQPCEHQPLLVPTLHPQLSRKSGRTPVWHSSAGLPGGLSAGCGRGNTPVEASAAISCLLGHLPQSLAPPPGPSLPHAPTQLGPAAWASTLTEGADPGPPTWPGWFPPQTWVRPVRPESSERPAGSSCAALEWAEWRTSPQSWGAPQANQERLSRYKASQSGGSAPFPHSLPSQIVTMGTITKKTARKCNHFPVNFYPSAPLSPSASTASSP